MRGVAAEQQQRLNSRRIDRAQAEAELGDILVGGYRQEVHGGHGEWHQHDDDE
jgi:hypothetical protein